MKTYRLYQVDSFTRERFHGNPAGVVPNADGLTDEQMQCIAREMNNSDTAFILQANEAKANVEVRFFTPTTEVPLCGHATLGTSFVLFSCYETEAQQITYHTMSGDLFVSRENGYIVMDFPVYQYHETGVTDRIKKVMGASPIKAYIGPELMLIYEDEKTVRDLQPDFDGMMQLEGSGVAVTAPGSGYDCVSRYFAPKLKINEDPVTGSVHCMIVPYWAEQLGKNVINAYQASERGGELRCELCGDRVKIAGKAVLYSVDELNIDPERY